MTAARWEVLAIALVTAVACALPGSFLLLRRMAMMSDAVSHAVLLGIVLGFLAVGDLSSPLLLGGAALSGLLTVALVEALQRTGRVRQDAAIGLVFPALFSIGVLLIARHAGDVHLDTDAVLLGELAFAPFDRFKPWGVDLGPRALFVMGTILLLEVGALLAFYKELKLATFDPGLAAALGLAPGRVHWGLMAIVSITVVGAFDAVGSVLVVALMIAPPAAAWLLAGRLSTLLLLASGLGAVTALAGYGVARAADASLAGSMAAVAGMLFVLAWLLAPGRGLVALAVQRRGRRLEFALATLCIHLLQHRGRPEAAVESRVDHLHDEVGWTPAFAGEVARTAVRRGLARQSDGSLDLTDLGERLARETLGR